jgi:5'-deoxynucleotidase
MSHFFAWMTRMKFIRRWSLMHSTHAENIQEHSQRVAMIAHALAVVGNRLYGGTLSPERAATLALYHDASEVLTGDLPRPVKYFNPAIETAYHTLERVARERLLATLPAVLQPDYRALFMPGESEAGYLELVKAADKLCAYLKCLEETSAGNREFAEAEKVLRQAVESIDLPAARYFLDTFVPSFRPTLDELK